MDVTTLFADAPETAMRLRSGGVLNLAAPAPSAIVLGDIAAGLSRICRFGGQPRRFYSVAEHSVHAVRIAQRRGYSIDQVRAIALHDAAEAYVGDMIRPLRVIVPAFAAVERAVQIAIYARFGVGRCWLEAESFRSIDDGLLVTEYGRLFDVEASGPAEFESLELRYLEPAAAERLFLGTCYEVGLSD